MKKLLLLIYLSHFTYPSFAQDWIRYYGYGSQTYSSYCIEHYDKGYLLAGNINTPKYGWLIKTDINGNELWNIKVGDGIHLTGIKNVENTFDNGLILSGTTTLYNSTHTDPFIIKLNSCGDIEWCKVLIYDSAGDGAIRVKQTMDGGYVLCAILYGDIPNNIVHLFKFDSTGELFWHKMYNGDSLVESEYIRDLYIDQQFFLLTGECYYPNWLKPYYIQTDTSGNETWSLAYSQHTGLGFVGDAWASVRDIHGNYYSAGSSESSPELIKFSSQGEEIMNVDLFPSATIGGAGTILGLNDTSYIMCAEWSVGSLVYLAILGTDTLGNIKKIKYLPNPGNVIISGTAKTYDNKILLIVTDYIGANSRIELFKFNSDLEYDSVYTHHFTYDSLCPDTIVSHTIMPDCDVIVDLQESLSKPETAALKVFPNPANQKITVEFPKYVVVKTGQPGFGSTTVYHHWKSTTLEVYDLSGKKIVEKEIVRAQTSMELYVSRWPRGMYYFRLVYNKHAVAGEKVVVE
jgi:hypothetical protein